MAPHTQGRLLFLESRLIEGTGGFAGELGHLPIEASVIAQLNKENPFLKKQIARRD